MQPANRYSADQWETIMVQMRIEARLSKNEADAILDFLKGGARRAAASAASPPFAVLARLASTELMFPHGDDTVAELFRRNCAPCHGSEGKGDGPAAPALRPQPVDLTDSTKVTVSNDEELLAVISDGRGSMPGFSTQLTPEQLTALRNFVRALSGKD
jgi:mono/diheme cytochrome c family protein